MFKTDATVRFGQILSARTLRYSMGNLMSILLLYRKRCARGPSAGAELAEAQGIVQGILSV